MRQKLLNKFCQRLYKLEYLMKSEEMQLFLSNTVTDVKKALSGLPIQTTEDLVQKYKEVFVDFHENYDAAAGRQKICDFQLFLKKALSNLRVNKYFIK